MEATMALKGEGFMAVWHDIKSEGEEEYSLWHTYQHMPERVSTPGFEKGRRYVDWSLDKYRWFTLYEGQKLDTFNSEEYRRRLNNPTEWTTKMQPNFMNFARSACETIATNGIGIGGALATIRLNLKDGGEEMLRDKASKLVEDIAKLSGVTGAHIGWANPTVTRLKTRETELRKLTGEDVFDAVVMVDCIGRKELEPLTGKIESLLDAELPAASKETATYDLAYLLTSEEL
jgi:hypothetical protein